jgi:hypothetical protein
MACAAIFTAIGWLPAVVSDGRCCMGCSESIWPAGHLQPVPPERALIPLSRLVSHVRRAFAEVGRNVEAVRGKGIRRHGENHRWRTCQSSAKTRGSGHGLLRYVRAADNTGRTCGQYQARLRIIPSNARKMSYGSIRMPHPGMINGVASLLGDPADSARTVSYR